MAKAEDFFLDAKSGGFAEFRGPMRTASEVQPLIDGLAIYSHQEEAIFKAKSSVLITSWAFDPFLRISSRKIPSKIKNWGSLLVHIARERAVAVQILMTDYDPMFFTLAHGFAWMRYGALLAGAQNEGIPEEMFQVVVARHPAKWTPSTLLNLIIESRYDTVIAELNAAKDKAKATLGFHPGLWDKVDVKDTGISLRKPGTIFPVFPASFHQKLILIDEAIAYVAGINHIHDNLDNRKHSLLPGLRWHDGCVRVQGAILEDIIKSAFAMWNEEWPRAKSFIDQANKELTGFSIPFRQTRDLVATKRKKPLPPGTIPSQAWRTISRGITAADQPDTTCKDIIDGYLKAISVAEKFIYIENQYLRDERLGNAMIDRLKTAPSLNVIVVLPNVTEELLKTKGDPISFTGAAHQFKIIKSLEAAFGDRFGVFSLFTPKNPPKMIYVHNKVMIVDDAFATLGSANANQRGFELDTELNVAWHHPRSVKALRRDLWLEILGAACRFDSWKPANFAKEWTKRAKKNEGLAAALRQGFVMPFANDVEGFDLPLIPNWLAQSDTYAPRHDNSRASSRDIASIA